MTCDVDRLSRFLEGDISPGEYRVTAQHLRVCAQCREALAGLGRVDRVVSAWGSRREPIPVATERRLHASISRRRRMRPLAAASRMMPAALGTTVAALLVLVSTNFATLYSGRAQPSGPSVTVVATKTLRKQSAPLLYARGKSAVTSSRPTGNETVRGIDRHFPLDMG